MLILTRRIGERLMIGDDVAIDILKINGRQVRLGITAPKNITVLREEVYQESKAVKKVVNNQKTKGQLL